MFIDFLKFFKCSAELLNFIEILQVFSPSLLQQRIDMSFSISLLIALLTQFFRRN